jgi:hypothetical protein
MGSATVPVALFGVAPNSLVSYGLWRDAEGCTRDARAPNKIHFDGAHCRRDIAAKALF